MSKDASFHHKQAAELLELAAFHHREAAKFHKTGDSETAAHHARLAHGHLMRAIDHVEEAAKALRSFSEKEIHRVLPQDVFADYIVSEVERC